MGPQQIAPVKARAAYELVTEQLKRGIHLGLFVPGDKLPPERDLAKQLGVSRMTAREAIRALAAQGFLTISRGAHGGITVTSRELSRRELLGLAADADRSVGDVYEFRLVVECAAARLAAERATAKDIRQLRNLVETMDELAANKASREDPRSVWRFMAADSQFHLTIARISGNALLCEAVERSLSERFTPLGAVFGALSENANAGHEELVTAISQHEANKAERLMAAHIRGTMREMLAILSRVKSGHSVSRQ